MVRALIEGEKIPATGGTGTMGRWIVREPFRHNPPSFASWTL